MLDSWLIAGINTTARTSGYSLLALGLRVPWAAGSIMVEISLIGAFIAVVARWLGSRQYLGFSALCRGVLRDESWLLAGSENWFVAAIM